VIEKVLSKNGIQIRLTDERWAHIVEEHCELAGMGLEKYLWSSYDAEADVLYINFKKPSHASDSELTDDDVIIRYEGDIIVGLTILHASTR
jgi:uncharacterized protein YuzE